jgi:hypothetical protein
MEGTISIVLRARGIVGATLLCAAGLMTSPLAAQTAAPPTAVGQGLNLQGSFSGGYDANAGSPTATVQSPLFQGSNENLGGNLHLSFSPPAGRRFGFTTSGGSSFRAYRGAAYMPINHYVSAGVSAGLAPHVTAKGSVSTSYLSLYQFDVSQDPDPTLLGQTTPQPLGYTLAFQNVLSYGASGSLAYRPTDRSSFSLDYRFRDVSSGNRRYFLRKTHDASAAYRRSITKGLAFRLGYRYWLSEYADPATGQPIPVRRDNIDIGLDYNRSGGLSIAPRTTFTFGIGTGAHENARYGDPVYNNGRFFSRYRLVGHANLTHKMFRTWSANVLYIRGVSFDDFLTAPVFSDSVNARIGGQLRPRLSFAASTAYSFGELNTVSSAGSFHSHSTSARLRAAVSRHVGLFVQYFHYNHGFSDPSFLILNAPSQLSRQGVRAGLDFSMHLL